MTFPILRLPIVAMEHILTQVNDCDLFDLSLCSKRSARIVGSLPRMPTRMEIHIGAGIKSINLFRDGEDWRNPFVWKFNFVKIARKRKWNREISGVKMFCVKNYYKDNIPLKPGARVFEVGYKKQTIGRDIEMGAVITHLLRTFKRCKLTKVHVNFNRLQPEFRVGHVFSGEFPIQNLEFYGEPESSSLNSLEILRKCQILSFCSRTRNMHKESILHLDIPQVDFWYSNYDSEDIMNFLKKWKFTSGMKRINCIVLHSREPIAPLDYEQLGAQPWDPKKRDAVYRGTGKHTIYCAMGMDIEREDGLLATIHIINCTVYFVVWHERFSGESNN